MNNSKKLPVAKFVFLLAACFAFLGLCLFLYQGFTKEVVVAKVARGNLNDSVTGNVRVLAQMSYDLRSEVPGLAVYSILLPLGKPVEVKVNQLLFQLDSTDLNRSLRRVLLSQESHLKRLEVGSSVGLQLQVEEKDLDAVKELSAESDGVALLDLEKKENHVQRLQQQFQNEEISNHETSEGLKIEIERLTEELKSRKILSPIDGILVSSSVKPGGTISGGQFLGQVVSHDRVVEVSLNEENFVGLKSGQKAGISLFAFGSKVFEGVVDRIAATIDSATGRRILFVNLDDNRSLPIGASGRAEIIKSRKIDTLVIPRKALLGNSVLVVRKNIVKIVQVKVGARNLEKVEVLEGLEEGEHVITETPHLYHEGDRVDSLVIH